MKSFKTAMASLALATLLVGQSAQAATRSSDSLPASGASFAAVERAGAPVGSAEALGGAMPQGEELVILLFGSVLAFLAFLEAVGAIDIIDGGNDSPG